MAKKKHLGTRQKLLRLPLGKWRTAREGGKIIRQTLDNVRIREEAAARSTKVIERRVLKKQARKARAEHSVKFCLALEKKESPKKATVIIVR